MKIFKGVQGSQLSIPPPIEVNVDTVYVRTNIVAINTDEFKGWQYDEVQYSKDEYIALISTQATDTHNALVDFLLNVAPSL